MNVQIHVRLHHSISLSPAGSDLSALPYPRCYAPNIQFQPFRLYFVEKLSVHFSQHCIMDTKNTNKNISCQKRYMLEIIAETHISLNQEVQLPLKK